jgi:hypothetical protein
MRVILRDVKSGEYYKGAGQWTRTIEAAKDYLSAARAVEAALRAERQCLEIILAFDDPFYNVTLPVNRLDKPRGNLPPEDVK